MAVGHSASTGDLRNVNSGESEQELFDQDDDDLKVPNVEPADPDVVGKMRLVFSNYVIPMNVLNFFHCYNSKVLVEKDLQCIKQEKDRHGDIEAATMLFNRLRHYPHWYQCMLMVLCDPAVKMKHVAQKLSQISGIPPEKEDLMESSDSEDEVETSSNMTHVKTVVAPDVVQNDGLESDEADNASDTDQCVRGVERMQLTDYGRSSMTPTLGNEVAQQTNDAERRKWQKQVQDLEEQVGYLNKQNNEAMAVIQNFKREKQEWVSLTARQAGLEQELEEAVSQKETLALRYKEAQREIQQQRVKISQLQKDIKDAERKVLDMQKQQGMGVPEENDVGTGFRVHIPASARGYVEAGGKVKCLSEVTYDSHKAYDIGNCIYSVPITGCYKVTLAHTQKRDGRGQIILNLIQTKCSGRGENCIVIKTSTKGRANVGSHEPTRLKDQDERHVNLSAGDQLWVKAAVVGDHEKLMAPTSFSGFLVQ